MLLAHDVAHVFAVDVGHSQLSNKIAKVRASASRNVMPDF